MLIKIKPVWSSKFIIEISVSKNHLACWTPEKWSDIHQNPFLGNIGHAEHAQECPGCPPLQLIPDTWKHIIFISEEKDNGTQVFPTFVLGDPINSRDPVFGIQNVIHPWIFPALGEIFQTILTNLIAAKFVCNKILELYWNL